MSEGRRAKIDAIASAIIGATSMFPDPEQAARYYAEKALNALEEFEGSSLQPNDDCPECGGDLHLWEDRYEQGDGQWLVCEDCSFEMRYRSESRSVRG